VPWDVMVKGFEYEKGHYVLLSDEDIQKVKPQLTRTIAIDDFVDLDEIDPILFDKPYYLEPDTRGQRAYALLRETLRQTGKAGIARVVIRTREYLTAMFARDQVIVLMLLRFPQEMNAISKLELPAAAEYEPKDRELELAVQLVKTMSAKWDPQRYHDQYRVALLDYIENKVRQGETATNVSRGVKEDDSKSDANVVDLMEYLQRSVEGKSNKGSEPAQARSKPTRKSTSEKARTKKAPSTKAAPKKTPTKQAAKRSKRSA
jgi:DNA end-binding protein Ku